MSFLLLKYIVSLTYAESVSQEIASQRFAFGRDLRLLPQHELSDMGGTVPQYVQ